MNDVARQADTGQGIVVTAPVAFEKVRQVQRGLGQQPVADQVKRNQQPPDAAVAVQKRVDGFELVVADGQPDQMGHGNDWVVPKLFQIAHQFGHAVLVWRNERRIGQVGAANPVLADAELSRLLVLAPYTAHQNGVGLTQQAVGQRQGAQLVYGVVDGINVVADFAPVVALFGADLVFRQQGFVHAGLRALDATGGLRLLGHVHFDEQINVWNDQRKGVELAQCAVGGFQQQVDMCIFPMPIMVDRYGLETLVLQALLPMAG